MKNPGLVAFLKRVRKKRINGIMCHATPGVVSWNLEVMTLRQEYNDLEMKIDRMKKRQKTILRKVKLYTT